MVYCFKGFTTVKTRYTNNCSNCYIFELEPAGKTECPLFVSKPHLPKKGEPLELNTEEGLAKFLSVVLSVVTCVMKCEYHLSKEQAERMNNKPVHKNGRFDTLDLESE